MRLFAARDLCHFAVGKVVAVNDIEAQQPQVARQLPEIGIDDEARVAQGFVPQPYQRADVQALEHGVDADAVARLDDIGKIHGPAVDQDHFHFGVRHAEGFDQVLDRSAPRELMGKSDLAPLRRQKIIQFFIEAQLHLCHERDASRRVS